MLTLTIKDRWLQGSCVSVVLEATHEASQGRLKGTVVTAQKALQGSQAETRELLEGTKEKGIFPVKGHCCTYLALPNI